MWGLRNLGLGLYLCLNTPAFANDGAVTPVGKILQQKSSDGDALVRAFEKLSKEEKGELLTLLSTKLYSWNAIERLRQQMLWENEVKPSVLTWVHKADSRANADNVKFFTLQEGDVTSKLSLFKLDCNAESPQSPKLGWFERGILWLKKLSGAEGEQQAGLSGNFCEARLRVSLVVDEKRGSPLKEFPVLEMNRKDFPRLKNLQEWAPFESRVWLALERQFSEQKEHKKSLAERVRVVELLGGSFLTKNEFIQKRQWIFSHIGRSVASPYATVGSAGIAAKVNSSEVEEKFGNSIKDNALVKKLLEMEREGAAQAFDVDAAAASLVLQGIETPAGRELLKTELQKLKTLISRTKSGGSDSESLKFIHWAKILVREIQRRI